MSLVIPKMRMTRRIGLLRGAGAASLSEPLPLHPRGVRMVDITPEDVAYYMQKVSRERALKAYNLKRKGVNGTLPELLAYDWLERKGYQFDFQSSIMGGRLVLGGAVADFIIFDLFAGGLAVWRIQGNYWHVLADREQKDAVQKDRLLSERYMNLPVLAVVDLWEDRIYYGAPAVFEQAEAGAELGPM